LDAVRHFFHRWLAGLLTSAFCICCARQAALAVEEMRKFMQRLKLTANEEKTHLCCVPAEYFEFQAAPAY
jgi:hypothetical protein